MSRTVTIIPARGKLGTSLAKEEVTRLRVAAYCRVSTDSEEQESSYDAQVKHYTEYIQKNPKWQFAGIFADDGISGTYTKKREGFNRMIDECMEGKIDMIITKSISRFARNTLDCLKYVRMLREHNIEVFFEKEGISSTDEKAEVIFTIMASLAQQESQSLSQNVKLGIQYRYQQGQVIVNCTRFLGYTKDENGQLVPVPEEAEIVRRIFREYLEGASLNTIAKGLEADGILTGAGKKNWRPETVKKMLSNEKYMGDALLQKTVTTDFLNKTRVANNGEEPQYYVEDNHEAIIPKEIFMRAQQEMIRRSNLAKGAEGKRKAYSGKYALTGIVFCSECGDNYRRTVWQAHGKTYYVWRCSNRLKNGPGACRADVIHEEDLHRTVVRTLNKALRNKDAIKDELINNVQTVLNAEVGPSADQIDEQLDKLQDELLKSVSNKENYDDIAKEIHRLRGVKEGLAMKSAEINNVKARVNEIRQFLDDQDIGVTEYDDKLTRKLIRRITVYDDHFVFELKSGLEIEIRK